MTELQPDALVALAERERDSFACLIQGIPYERKGILSSEMFFLWLCARRPPPRRVLESGRARAQSTLILSRAFPECEIISVEHDRQSPDVAVAAKRLKGAGNVKMLFGDATALLPALAAQGDIALIDGPKGYRGLRLALRLLASGRLSAVFVHDTGRGTPERVFLEKHVPEALYSDDPRFAGVTHPLDHAAAADIPAEHRWQDGPPAAGYGFSLACLPWHPDKRYRRALAAAVVEGLAHRLFGRSAAHG